MKKITLLFLFLLLALSGFNQKIWNNKKYNWASITSPVAFNLASDNDAIFIYGTKTLSADFTFTVTGTPVDGMKLLIFYDGTSLTITGLAYKVVMLGTNLTTKQTASKLIILAIYKTSAWEVRVMQDAETTMWIGKTQIDTLTANRMYDNSTIDFTVAGGMKVKDTSLSNNQIKANANIAVSKLAALSASKVAVTDAAGHLTVSAVTPTQLGYVDATSSIQTQLNTKTTSGSIMNADINGSAAIDYAKLNLSNSILAADIYASAAIPYSKLLLTAALVNTDVSSTAAIAMTKLAALTATIVPITNSSGFLTSSSVTPTELGYLSGATSNIQAQLNTVATGVVAYTTVATTTYLHPSTLKSHTWVNTTAGAIDIYVPRPDSAGAGVSITFTSWFTNGTTLHTYAAYNGFRGDFTGVAGTTYAIGVINGDYVTLVSDGVFWNVAAFKND